jgi:hypothetical protein
VRSTFFENFLQHFLIRTRWSFVTVEPAENADGSAKPVNRSLRRFLETTAPTPRYQLTNPAWLTTVPPPLLLHATGNELLLSVSVLSCLRLHFKPNPRLWPCHHPRSPPSYPCAPAPPPRSLAGTTLPSFPASPRRHPLLLPPPMGSPPPPPSQSRP